MFENIQARAYIIGFFSVTKHIFIVYRSKGKAISKQIQIQNRDIEKVYYLCSVWLSHNKFKIQKKTPPSQIIAIGGAQSRQDVSKQIIINLQQQYEHVILEIQIDSYQTFRWFINSSWVDFQLLLSIVNLLEYIQVDIDSSVIHLLFEKRHLDWMLSRNTISLILTMGMLLLFSYVFFDDVGVFIVVFFIVVYGIILFRRRMKINRLMEYFKLN